MALVARISGVMVADINSVAAAWRIAAAAAAAAT